MNNFSKILISVAALALCAQSLKSDFSNTNSFMRMDAQTARLNLSQVKTKIKSHKKKKLSKI